VADLEPAREFIIAQGRETLGKFPRAVSIGIRLSDAIIDQHKLGEKREHSLYRHHIDRVVNPALDLLAQKIQHALQTDGFKVFPIPASLPNYETMSGIFSHKLAAHLAGLGWIGKSCLLITPDFGPRVRLVTVLTDAPLPSGTPLNKKCGECQICVDACPAKAFTGIEFQASDPVEVRFNTRACDEYLRPHPCVWCVVKCPISHRT